MLNEFGQKKNVVILGAGFGGLKCALTLENLMRQFPVPLFENFNIVLIDKNSYHLYTPALYEVAATHKEDSDALNLKKIVGVPIEEIIENKKINFYQALVSSIDLKNKVVIFDQGNIPFEYLVLALGSESAFFGIKGAEEYSYPLKNLADAIKIRGELEKIFSSGSPIAYPQIIIAGAGSTGVEFAGEIIGFLKNIQKKHQRYFGAKIALIDYSSTVLSGSDEEIVIKATQRLNKIGVNLNLGKTICQVNEHQIIYREKNSQEETIDFDLLIWTAGVKAPKIISDLPLCLEKRGQAIINKCLICAPFQTKMEIGEKILAIGDSSCLIDPKTNRPLPGTARIALSQAKIAAKNIILDIFKQPKIEYYPRPYPYIIPIGEKYAVCKIGKFKIFGFFGWVLKMLVELYYLFSILPIKKALFIWFRGLRIFLKND